MMYDEDEIDGTRQAHWISIRKFEDILKDRLKSKSFSQRSMMGYTHALIDPNYDASIIPAHDVFQPKALDLIRYKFDLPQSIVASAAPKNDTDMARFLSIIYKTRSKLILNLVCTIKGDEATKLPANYGEQVLAIGYRSKNLTPDMIFDPSDQLYQNNDTNMVVIQVESMGMRTEQYMTSIALRMSIIAIDPERPNDFSNQVDQHDFEYLHYEAWVDNGVISYSEMNMLIDMVQDRTRLVDTFLVHCWSGIGRTGTFLTDYLLRLLLEHQLPTMAVSRQPSSIASVDDVILWLRQYRQNMVFTAGQYLSIYDFLSNHALMVDAQTRQTIEQMIQQGDLPVDADLDQRLRDQRRGRVKSRLVDDLATRPLAMRSSNLFGEIEDDQEGNFSNAMSLRNDDRYFIASTSPPMMSMRPDPGSPSAMRPKPRLVMKDSANPSPSQSRISKPPRPNFAPRVLNMNGPLLTSTPTNPIVKSSQTMDRMVMFTPPQMTTPSRSSSRRDQKSSGSSRRRQGMTRRFDLYDDGQPQSPTSVPAMSAMRRFDSKLDASNDTNDLMSSQSFNLNESIYSQSTPQSNTSRSNVYATPSLDALLDEELSDQDQQGFVNNELTPNSKAVANALGTIRLRNPLSRPSGRFGAISPSQPRTPPRM